MVFVSASLFPSTAQVNLSILIKARSARDKLCEHVNPELKFALCKVALQLWLLLFYPCLLKSACQQYSRSRPDSCCWRFSAASHVWLCREGVKKALWQRRGFQAFLWRDLVGGTLSGPGCGEDNAERGQCAGLSTPAGETPMTSPKESLQSEADGCHVGSTPSPVSLSHSWCHSLLEGKVSFFN